MSDAPAKKAARGRPGKRAAVEIKTSVTAGRGRNDLGATFQALRALLSPYEGRLAAKSPKPDYYYLESLTPTYKNRPMFFAAVRTGKNYVSYHLMSIYTAPEMMKGISPELTKRMQGKACFNFTGIDEALFKQLATLTQAGYENFKKRGWL
jgi:hypothetical protein